MAGSFSHGSFMSSHQGRARDLRIAGSGAATTRLHFAPEPEVRPTLIEDARIWSRTLRVADAGSMREGRGMRSGYDLRTARRSMNLLMIEWQNRGINMWTIDEGTVSLTSPEMGCPPKRSALTTGSIFSGGFSFEAHKRNT